jgi:hypothetical protein
MTKIDMPPLSANLSIDDFARIGSEAGKQCGEQFERDYLKATDKDPLDSFPRFCLPLMMQTR